MIFYKFKYTIPEQQASSEEELALNMFQAFGAEAATVDGVTFYGRNSKEKLQVLLADTKGHMKEELSSISETFIKNYFGPVDTLDLEELTLPQFAREIHMAFGSGRNGCDEEAVLSSLNIRNLGMASRRHYKESLFENRNYTRKEALEKCQEAFLDLSLQEEVKRIYRKKNPLPVIVHPCHYLVVSDDEKEREEILAVLLSSLKKQKRLLSRRLSLLEVDIKGQDPSCCVLEGFSELMMELSKNIVGGSVVLHVNGDSNDDEDEIIFVTSSKSDVTEALLAGRRDVLTVLTMDTKTYRRYQDFFYEKLEKMNFIPIFSKRFSPKEAEEYLVSKASSMKGVVKDDFKTFLKKEEWYSRYEVENFFTQWLDQCVTTSVFPAYKDKNALSAKREEKHVSSAYEQLQKMIGLEKAKSVVDEAIAYNEMEKHYKSCGVKQRAFSRHMVFSGNPGTAKTTVARLFARIMKEKGILEKGELIEVGRSDLIGKYVGHTAPLVKAVFNSASGSVLFIDEAYSLVDDHRGLYGDEAINTIVQEMENHRSDVIVIFAGYPDRMEQFLNTNPGLRSRISFSVPFDDYSVEELREILDMIAGEGGMTVSKDADEKLKAIFGEAMTHPDFGNGRFSRNLYEHAVLKQAGRLASQRKENYSKSELLTLTAEDFEMPKTMEQKIERRIGF